MWCPVFASLDRTSTYRRRSSLTVLAGTNSGTARLGLLFVIQESGCPENLPGRVSDFGVFGDSSVGSDGRPANGCFRDGLPITRSKSPS